jgi:hypothetical protein
MRGQKNKRNISGKKEKEISGENLKGKNERNKNKKQKDEETKISIREKGRNYRNATVCNYIFPPPPRDTTQFAFPRPSPLPSSSALPYPLLCKANNGE